MVRIPFGTFLLEAAGGGVPEGPQGGPFGPLGSLLLPMVAVFFIFWLLVFRPESRKRKEREAMVRAVKKGDLVVTSGGIIGKVWRVETNEVILLIDTDDDVKVRFSKSSLLDVIRTEGAPKGDEGGS